MRRMEVTSTSVKISCIKCGAPTEVKSSVYQGKDIIKLDLFKTGQFHPDDPYALVHLLCNKCDMKQGFQKGIDSEDEEKRERIRKFIDK
jgi:hypothetical protein